MSPNTDKTRSQNVTLYIIKGRAVNQNTTSSKFFLMNIKLRTINGQKKLKKKLNKIFFSYFCWLEIKIL